VPQLERLWGREARFGCSLEAIQDTLQLNADPAEGNSNPCYEHTTQAVANSRESEEGCGTFGRAASGHRTHSADAQERLG
jgi:hypothetical protein